MRNRPLQHRPVPNVDLPGVYLEVLSRDVALSEPMSTVVTERGESIARCRVWVRAGSTVRRVTPFQV